MFCKIDVVWYKEVLVTAIFIHNRTDCILPMLTLERFCFRVFTIHQLISFQRSFISKAVHTTNNRYKIFLNLYRKNKINIVAAFRGMHVSPAKHSYAWLPRKCDYRTDRQIDGQTDQTDAGQSDPCVLLCFAGDTKISKFTKREWMNEWMNESLTDWMNDEQTNEGTNERMIIGKHL